MDDIGKELEVLEIENSEHKYFVPLNKLQRLFTRERVLSLLQKNDINFYDRAEVTEAVLNNGLRLFAILVSIRSISCIGRFQKSNYLSDAQLDSALPMDTGKLMKILQNEDTCRAFFRKQWTFCVPIFRENQSYQELDNRTILPFLTLTKVSSGGFSTIFKARLDASHHQILGAQNEVDLICKQLTQRKDQSTMEKDFADELHILSSLRCLKHPNIIKLITAYIKEESYNFLLPAADGDFRDFLRAARHFSYFMSTNELIGSLWGLSSAIEAVHEFFADDFDVRLVGCHYDIKPGNILCHDGKLVLSDFGLSKLRPEEDGFRSMFQQGEGCYIAPECEPSDQDFNPRPIGRASDVWSFGCVLAETLAYIGAPHGEGHKMVEKFHKDRKIKLGPYICHNFHGVQGINPVVSEFLQAFITQDSAPEVLKSIAFLVSDILQFAPALRPTASTITQRLFRISQSIVFHALYSTLEHCQSSMELDVLIELERFNIWGDAVGLKTGEYHSWTSSWFDIPHSYPEYRSVQELLNQCLQEAKFITNQLESNSDPPYRLAFHLQRLQDSLWDIQPPTLLRYMTGRLEDRILSKGYGDGFQRAYLNYSASIHSPRVLGDQGRAHKRVALLAQMQEIASSIVQQDSSSHDLSINKLSLIPPMTIFHQYHLKTLDNTGQRVLIEFVDYRNIVVPRVNELLERVNAIASLRSRGIIKDIFPVLECKGYYHNAAAFHFGIVYELPSLGKNTDPRNLIQVIHDTKSRVDQPSLTAKFKLASTLVLHIHSFHTGRWLHKNICAFNIVFFPGAFATLADSFSYPYFIGLNHSRSNDENAFSNLAGPEAEYQHPIYLQNSKKFSDDPQNPVRRYRQEFDYYSLGLVLLEIALWQPLRKITGKISGSPEKVQQELLRSQIPIVKAYMGDRYGEAVEYCLSFDLGEDRSPDVVRDEFYGKVVDPLSQCSL